MPELPEVETIVRDLRPVLVGRRLAGAVVRRRDILHGVSPQRLVTALRGVKVTAVERRAKHAVLELESGSRLVVQPGMTGSLIYYRRPPRPEQAPYAALRLTLERGGEVVYEDVRRFGRIRLLDEAEWRRFGRSLGPEPLDESFTPARLAEAFRDSTVYVKKALMDQRRVVGVGNIYANEALFASGIDPSRAAGGLSSSEIGRLHAEVRRILAAAIASSGTTLRDYRTGTGEPGHFQLELFVYGREGEACRTCGTTLTGTHALDARITVFCHKCQE